MKVNKKEGKEKEETRKVSCGDKKKPSTVGFFKIGARLKVPSMENQN